MKILRPLVVLVLALVGAAGPVAWTGGHAADPIQPGDYVEVTDAKTKETLACTLDFVFDGAGALAGRVFIGTAAHCVTAPGQAARTIDNVTFGHVALIGNAGSTTDDYALIEVDAAHVGDVSPAVKGHPRYPTGVATLADTNDGDMVQASGYGIGFELTGPTREARQAVLTHHGQSEHSILGPVIYGDSGGPLVHVRSGKALGIVSRLCEGACTEEGPTVEGVLARSAAAGFTVALRTV